MLGQRQLAAGAEIEVMVIEGGSSKGKTPSMAQLERMQKEMAGLRAANQRLRAAASGGGDGIGDRYSD